MTFGQPTTTPPPSFDDLRAGVAYTPPPASMLAEATRIAESIGAHLGPNGGIVAVKTDAGYNGAIVLRVGEHVRVAGWIGKNWGTTVKGGMFQVNF